MHMITDPDVKAVQAALQVHLRTREPFVAFKGKLTGCPVHPATAENWDNALFGELPSGLVTAVVAAHPRFVVWSYSTPVAWLASDAEFLVLPPARDTHLLHPDSEEPIWALPAWTPSTTSERHQRIVASALGGRNGYEIAEAW